MIKFLNSVWFPAKLGVLLLLVNYVDVNYFNDVPSDINASLIREQVILFIGLIGSIINLGFCIRCIYLKHWNKMLYSLLSILVFLICFVIAAAYGGAFTSS